MLLRDLVQDVRSKNAGPYWITVDVFCGNEAAFKQLDGLLTSTLIASIYQQPESTLKRFALPELNVLKFSFPRPVVQGDRFDRDMHGAQFSVLLSELEIN